MVFSSISFIYYFLPIVLLIYFILPNKYKNLVLLISSLFFYFYGENTYIWVLLLSCFINYLSGILLDKVKKKNNKKIILIITIIIDLGLLCYFKYTNFFIQNINHIFKSNIDLLHIVLPLGISFFTFQTLSYVIDVYNGKVKANRNIINFACYVTLFPQLIAGPIVRYKDINKELENRKITIDDFGEGVRRFIIGLSKKVLIANNIGEMISILTSLNNPTIVSYILVAIGYTIQIYFDFSGYSDMAIGLGRMFGFHFLENFNYPLIAKNITDFWRRWHISLSSFFRDYVYIPLGGNRVSIPKHLRNILIVWLLTGFWHGATWNFIIWGLYFGLILIIEKYFLKDFLEKHPIFSHIYTTILVIISFIIFNTDTFKDTLYFLKNMFGLNHLQLINFETIYYLKSYLTLIIISFITATPLLKNIKKKLTNNEKSKKIFDILEIITYMFLLIIITAYLIDTSFNPFLYFRF